MGLETRGGAESPEQEAAKEYALKQYRDVFQSFKQATEQWVVAMLEQKNLALRMAALERVESSEENVNQQEEELLRAGMSIIDVAELRRQLATEK